VKACKDVTLIFPTGSRVKIAIALVDHPVNWGGD